MQNNVPLDIVRQAYLYDLDRISKGGTPMSDREAATSILAAQGLGGEAGRGGPGGVLGPVLGFVEGAAADLRDIVTGLPRLPGFLLEEPKRIGDSESGLVPSVTEGLEDLTSGDISGLGKIAGAPGVRLLPGSFTAEMIGKGAEGDKGPTDLVEHPLFTFLDLLPIASKAGLTAKAVKRIKESSPYRRTAAGLERRGVGGAAVDVNRMVRQVQRAADEGLVGEVPLGASGKVGSIFELRELLISWTKQFNPKEMAQTFEHLEQGRWAPGAPAPEWARTSGRGSQWIEMVTDAKAMGDFWADHGLTTGEIAVIDGHVFPLTADVKQYIRAIQEAKSGKKATLKKLESSESSLIRETGRVEGWLKKVSAAVSELAGVDAIKFSERITDAVSSTERLKMSDLGVGDDIAAFESRLAGEAKSVDRLKPVTETVIDELPWPDDVPPLRSGESAWVSGSRSPTFETESVVRKAHGRPPRSESGKLLALRRKLDGSVVGEQAAELVVRRAAAEKELARVSALRRLTPEEAANMRVSVDGKLSPGTLKDRVVDENAALGDGAFDLSAEIEVVRVDNAGHESTVTVTRLEDALHRYKREGWEEVTVEGKKFHRKPSDLRRAKQAVEHLVTKERVVRRDMAKGYHEVGSAEAASAATARLVAVIGDEIDVFLSKYGTLEETVRVEKIRDPSDYRIKHSADLFREGVDYPTRLTPGERNLIRSKRSSKIVADKDGVLWEITDYYPPGYEGVKTASWGARRELKDGSWEFKTFSDDALDRMAAIEPWDEADLAAFNVTERQGLTPAALDRILEDLFEVADVPAAEAFAVVDGRPVSVAAQRVLDRAAEILPDRLKSSVRNHKAWEPVRDLAEGKFTKSKVKIAESNAPTSGALADAKSRRIAAEETLATHETAAKAALKGADEVLEAKLAVEKSVKLEQQLAAKLKAVSDGTEQPLYYEAKETLKVHPDEVRLRDLYDTLDSIEAKGPSHELFTARDELLAAAKQLEDAGIVVKPAGVKAKALLGTRKARRVKKDGDPGALAVAKSRMSSTRSGLKKQRNRKARLDSALNVLKSEMVGTVDNPGPLRQAELAARNGEFTVARQKLNTAKGKLSSATMQEVRRLANDKAPKLADELDRIEGVIDNLYADMPTKAHVSQLRKSLPVNERKLAAAQKRLSLVEITIGRSRKKIPEEMDAAAKVRMKWESNPRKLPAVQQPLYRQVLTEMLAERLKSTNAPDAALQKVTFDSLDEAASKAGVPKKEWSSMKKEAMAVLGELIEQGRTPVWLPHRQIGNRGRSPTKLLGERIVTPQQFKQRHLNPEPYVRNLAVALEQSAVDQVRRLGTETLYFGDEAAGLPGVFPTFGRTIDDLMEQYSDAIAAELDASPWEPPQNVAQKIIDKDWVTIDPQKWGLSSKWAPETKIKYKRKGFGTDTEAINVEIRNIYVPRGVNATIEGFTKTGGLVPFRGAYDKVMDVFRVSALALSPRFLVYNGLGGMLMLMGRTDPRVLLQWHRAKKMVEDGEMPLGISKGAAMADPDMTRAFTQDISRLVTTKETGFMWGMAEGQWLGKIFDDIQKTANKSFQMNEWVDNVYRSMAYLDESDKALKRGATAAEAAEAGVKLANKILQDWDAMVPWERVAMRRIFPFYGWMKHVLKYTFTLPFDHPLRVSVLTNFAANEMEDYRTGIPQWLSHTFFVGKPGEDTKQWSVNMRSVNPFSDVARFADFDSREYGSGVLIGFFTQTSPLIAGVAETLGVNPMSGRSKLYPEMTYDPETGRLRSKAPNFLSILPASIIPQTQGVAGLVELSGVTSVSRELRNIRVRDPDAFKGRIWSSFGMPFAPRKRSRTFEMQRAGLARDQAAAEAVNRALRTGDWGDALGYDQARIRGQVFKVENLYELAKRNPEMLEVMLSATSR